MISMSKKSVRMVPALKDLRKKRNDDDNKERVIRSAYRRNVIPRKK